MIPEAAKEPVARALREAFGVTEFEDIRMMTAGLSSALVFRIVLRACPYLLRIVMNTDATVGPGRGDQTHHFACMKLAAEAGIGPRVWYTSTEDRLRSPISWRHDRFHEPKLWLGYPLRFAPCTRCRRSPES